jgi:hypothetical protein
MDEADYQLHEAEFLLRTNSRSAAQETSPHFVEPECLLPCSQEHATGHNPETVAPSVHGEARLSCDRTQ